MDVLIEKSIIRGKVDAPPSKSMTLRALVCASLSSGQTYLRLPSFSEDTVLMIKLLAECGIRIKPVKYGYQIEGGCFKDPGAELFCNDSAAVFRFMVALATCIPGTTRIVAGPKLAKRPVAPLVETLCELGVKCSVEGSTVVVDGNGYEGGDVTVPGDLSSQFISALMMVGPSFKHGINIRFSTPLKSRAYIDMTSECMKEFSVRTKIPQSYLSVAVSNQPYHETTYTPEGDWSFATSLLALGVITSARQLISTSTGNMSGNILITGLNAESKQADRGILNMIQKMGGNFTMRQSSVLVAASRLFSLNASFSDCVTLFPIMAVMASMVSGQQSSLRGLALERRKFNNDIDNTIMELTKLGIRCIDEGDSLQIMGGPISKYEADTHGSQRLGMALIILGVCTGRLKIKNCECVANVYPNIWDILRSVGVNFRIIE